MARMVSLRRSRADFNRASLRARASRAALSRSCASRSSFSRRLRSVSATARSSAALLRSRSAAAMASRSLPRRCSISAGRLASAVRSARVSSSRARNVSICSRALAMRFSHRALLGRDRLHALLPQAHLPLEAFERGFGAGMDRARFGGRHLGVFQSGLQVGEEGKLGECSLQAFGLARRFVPRSLGARLRFGQSAQLAGYAPAPRARRTRWRHASSQVRSAHPSASAEAP